jgi:hypothetical protein
MTTTYGVTGLAQTVTPQNVAALLPVNTNVKPVEVLTNAYRLLGVARGVNLNATGDAAVMPIINASSWAPALIVTSNGQVSGVAGTIATAAIGVFTAAAAGGSAIKANATLANNSAAGSAIALATTIANLAFTGSQVFINVGTALANATVDVFLYGYDIS